MATTIWVRYSFSSFRARRHLRHDVRPGRHNLDRRHARRRQRRPHRRRGPVRQQPTRRRNRPHARQAHMDDRFGPAQRHGFAIALLSVAVLLLAAYILLLSTPAMPTIAILAVTCAMCAAAAVAIARKNTARRCRCARSPHWRSPQRTCVAWCLPSAATTVQRNENCCKTWGVNRRKRLVWVCQAVDLQA